MPMGGFLDSFPAILFIAAHVIFIVAGIWAWRKAASARRQFAPAFWLYVASQLGFLAFFGGAVTMKTAVLVEQTLVVIMIVWIAARGADSA